MRGLVAQAFEIGQDFGLARGVERGQRFVQQQQIRRGQQRPAKRDASLLAAGKRRGLARAQRLQPQQGDDMVDLRLAGAQRRAAPAEAQIVFDAHMRKQPRVLKHIADAAGMRRHEDIGLRIENDTVTKGDAALARLQQAGNGAHDRALSGAGRTEQRRNAAGRNLERGFEREVAKAMAQGNANAHGPSIARARRWANSASPTPSSARRIDSAESRAASTSPPGAWMAL